MAALFANGLANQPYSRSADDGLALANTWIAAAVRCAPPDNKPTPAELAACHPFLAAELAALPRLRVYVALGRVAFDACRRLIGDTRGAPVGALRFEHGAVYRLPGAPVLIASYHPSRQNTHTGRLTPAMLRRVFRMAVRHAGA
jgi:uracil-DNA glycosylase family 4